MIERTTHMAFAKSLLYNLCNKDDATWEEIILGAKSKQHALDWIKSIPTEFYSPCDCKKKADGTCSGKPKEDD